MKFPRLLLGLLCASVVLPVSVVFAKETASGGTVVPVAPACSPVSSLSGRGDARVSETGLASVLVNWAVRPCDRNQSVRVSYTVLNYTTRAMVYTDSNAALNGRVEVLLPSRQLYQGIVTVFDATTGAVLGTQSVVVSTIPKGGV
jgi:hypothetical protein